MNLIIKRFSATLLALCACGVSMRAAPPPHVAGELVIKFKRSAPDAEIGAGLKLGKLKLKKHAVARGGRQNDEDVLTLAETELAVPEALARLKNHPAIEYVEPNYTYTHQATANDPYFTGGYLWGAYGDLSTPANAFGSQAAEAWSAGFTGSKNVYVGVIDEGVQISHPDLTGNIWKNPFDPADGIDNDGNGYVDDVNGWDFFNNRKEVFDAASGDDHGTHVAGTIGASGGNGAGIAGINWNVTMIAAKFMSGGTGSTFGAVAAINYFIDLKTRHGLDVVAINASWGGTSYSRALHDAVIRAAKAGIVFVAAAGNAGLNNDQNTFYPANIDTTVGTSGESAAAFNGVITVAAIDNTGALATFSNYGASRVHIGAPGVSILSTYPGSTYAYMNGTSMAAPHVAGAVALYASTHPEADAQQIRSALLGAAIPTSALSGKTTTGGRLNLSSVVVPLPAVPTGLTAAGGDGKVALKWNAVTGATSYRLERSTSAGGSYASVGGVITGTSFPDSGVSNGVTYYYRVSAGNSAGFGAPSASIAATPNGTVPLPYTAYGVTIQPQASTVAGQMTLTVNWKPAHGAQSYIVSKSRSRTGPWTVVATGVAGTTYTTTSAADGTAWYYSVTSVNSSGASAPSAGTGVYMTPPIPAYFKATATSSTTASLTWVDRSSDESGFGLEYYNGSSWQPIGVTAAGATVVNLSGVASGVTYSLRIRAVNQTAATAYSMTKLVMP